MRLLKFKKCLEPPKADRGKEGFSSSACRRKMTCPMDFRLLDSKTTREHFLSLPICSDLLQQPEANAPSFNLSPKFVCFFHRNFWILTLFPPHLPLTITNQIQLLGDKLTILLHTTELTANIS